MAPLILNVDSEWRSDVSLMARSLCHGETTAVTRLILEPMYTFCRTDKSHFGIRALDCTEHSLVALAAVTVVMKMYHYD